MESRTSGPGWGWHSGRAVGEQWHRLPRTFTLCVVGVLAHHGGLSPRAWTPEPEAGHHQHGKA